MKRRLLVLVPLGAAALAFACSDNGSANPVRPTVRGTLDVDIRGKVDVVIAPSDQGLDVTLSGFQDGYALFDPAAKLTAKGKVGTFPEVPSWEMVTATFPLAAAGPACAGKPAVLALSLVRRDGNARVQGSLTAYCGTQAAGVPARVLRLAGTTGS